MNFVFLLLFAVGLVFMAFIVSDANERFNTVNEDNRFLKAQLTKLCARDASRAMELEAMRLTLSRIESDRVAQARVLNALCEEKSAS